jgi:F0F1-type ATP synthase gamma subunit
MSVGTPKDKYVDFFFNQFGCYTNILRSEANEKELDRATAALIAICPDIKLREDLFKKYTENKKALGVVTASAGLAGNFMSYISDTLEFTEKSYASVF